jgi:hypothetical protein
MNSGPPSRANSQRDRILGRVRQAGLRGVSAAESYDNPQCRYGWSPRNRIGELRKIRHKIRGEWESEVDFGFTLIEETAVPKALPDYNAQKRLDWHVRQTGHGRPNLARPSLGPLFDSAVRG